MDSKKEEYNIDLFDERTRQLEKLRSQYDVNSQKFQSLDEEIFKRYDERRLMIAKIRKLN
jgi:hypothetical protein